MIKIGIRHNLLYPFLSIIFYFTREVISIILSSYLNFKSSLLLTLIMFIAEIIAGSIFYFNNFYFLSSKNERKRTKSGRITLIHSPSQMSRLDKRFKLYFLIFIAAYFQFISFKITTIYLIPFENKSLDIRLRSILPLLIGVLSLFTLRLPIVKHQIFSLTIILICLIITIILDSIIECFYFDNMGKYLYHLLFIFIRALIDAFVELSEKYLLEYNFINPFYIVMFEGFFGSIFISINSIETNPFKEIKEYEDNYIVLIIFLIIYFFLSGGRNIYRISTNKIYSPMARSLTDAFLDPLLICYYYFFSQDFYIEDQQNIFYFIANLILSIIVVFCVGVYNDFLVLYCCGLEHHTHYEISRRASKKENIPLLQLEKNFEDDGEGIN